MPMKKIIVCLLIAALSVGCLNAQKLTLDNAIKIAQENSFDGKVAQYTFLAGYWTYRSFQADLKPAVNLTGNMFNFNHSLVDTRNYEDGKVRYVDNNTLGNSLVLSLDQKIAATGGTVSLQSYLYRLDQFSYKEKLYNSQPLRISYNQPLMAYNSLKWNKKTAPLEYQIAQRTYMTSLETITMSVTSLFFSVISAQSNYNQSVASLSDREALYEIAKKRLEMGTTTKSEVLQLELSLLNARVSVNNNRIALDDAKYNLFSYLRVTDYENAELIPPYAIPDIIINFDDVLKKAINNSSHTQEQKLQMLEAERSLAQAKASQGLQMTLNGEIGFSQSSPTLGGVYSKLRDNEIIGLTLSLPIFDWGVRRGRVKMAQAQLDVMKVQIDKSHQDYIQELRRNVIQFNAQPMQCKDAQRAQEIAEERYDITRRRFEAGSISVTDLNTAQQELESAKMQYISQLQTFWTDYYTLRRATLYDWVGKRDLSVDFEEIINK